MRKLYREYFCIPKNEKICEKTIVTRLVSTIAVIVVCLVAMSITAYAYFSCNITSSSNFIKSADFQTNVNVKITDALGNEVQVITSNYKSHVVALKADEKYFIILKSTDRSTAKTGFVIVTAEGSTESYHTQQLGQDGSGNTDTLSFYLVPSVDMNVTFFAHWGTSSYYGYADDSELYIKQDETVNISIKPAITYSEFNDDNNTSNISSIVSIPTTSEPNTTSKPATSFEATNSEAVTYDNTTFEDVVASDIIISSTPEASSTMETPGLESGPEQIEQGE